MSQQMIHAVQSSTLADVLERVLDKGIVIAGDIKVKLVEVELLTIQIRLMIASVDKAREIGMDWWDRNPDFNSRLRGAEKDKEIERLNTKIASLERALPERATQVSWGGKREAGRPKQRVGITPRKVERPGARPQGPPQMGLCGEQLG